MKHKVCMVGLASGLVLGNLGFTHCSIEDIGSLRSIPNIAIIAPSDPYELYKVLNEAINYKDSIYIRLTAGSNSKIINEKDYDFKIGKSVEILPGKDVVIIGCGNILSNCLDAAKILKEKKIDCSVINMHTIKPIDKEKIKMISKNYSIAFTVEEHNVIGGLGSSVAEIFSEEGSNCKLVRIGAEDFYSTGGSYDYLKISTVYRRKKLSRKFLNFKQNEK